MSSQAIVHGEDKLTRERCAIFGMVIQKSTVNFNSPGWFDSTRWEMWRLQDSGNAVEVLFDVQSGRCNSVTLAYLNDYPEPRWEAETGDRPPTVKTLLCAFELAGLKPTIPPGILVSEQIRLFLGIK